MISIKHAAKVSTVNPSVCNKHISELHPVIKKKIHFISKLLWQFLFMKIMWLFNVAREVIVMTYAAEGKK